jgi:hypothetical protein
MEQKEMELIFETSYDVFQFILKTIDDNFRKGQKNVAYASMRHLISPFFASKDDFKTIKNIEKRGKVNYIVKSDSPLDQILSEFYRKFSSSVKLGVDLGYLDDIYIVNDLIIHVSLPSVYLKEIDDLYFDTKSILSFNMIKFFKSFAEKKVKIKIKIFKNRDEAERLRIEFSSKFN